MDRSGTMSVGRRWLTVALVAVGGMAVAPPMTGALEAQEPDRARDCRCVDANGNVIEECVCMRTPRVERAEVERMRRAVGRAMGAMHALHARARLGVMVSTGGAADVEGDVARDGVRLLEVEEDAPAWDAGLREGDVVVAVDGLSLTEPLPDAEAEAALDPDSPLPAQRFLALVRELEPEDEVVLAYRRDGERREAVVTAERWAPVAEARARVVRVAPRIEALRRRLEESRPAPDFETLVPPRAPSVYRFRAEACPPLRVGGDGERLLLGVAGRCVAGVVLEELNPDLGSYFGTEEGVLVTHVAETSTLGVRPGDVILAIDGREVEDTEDATRILRSYEPEESVTIELIRHGERMEVLGSRR